MLQLSKALINLWITNQRFQWSLVASFQLSEIVLIIFFDGPFTLDGKSSYLVLRGNNYSVFLLFEIENQSTPLQKLLQWGQG